MPTLRLIVASVLVVRGSSALQLDARADLKHCSRGTALKTAAWAAGGLAISRASAATADPTAAANTMALLRQARAQLEPVDGLIGEGSWDGVRNIVKTAPLANVKGLVTQYISEVGTDAAEDLCAPRAASRPKPATRREPPRACHVPRAASQTDRRLARAHPG